MRLRPLIIAIVIVGVSAQAAVPVAQRGAQQAARKPNVLLVIMDDMGYGDIGSYGVTDARTPNLDRLAREGVRLTDAYANVPSARRRARPLSVAATSNVSGSSERSMWRTRS